MRAICCCLQLCFGFALAAGLAACAEDLSNRLGPDAGPIPGGPVELLANDNGGFDVRVEAKSDDAWVYLDLSNAVGIPLLASESPGDDIRWDIAVRRFHLKLNGGASGTGMAAAAWLDQIPFDTVGDVPAGTDFVTDAPDDDDGDAEYVMSIGDMRWYNYNIMTHVLSPKEGTFVVRAASGSDYYRFEITEYYDDAGSAGYPRIRWSRLDDANGN